MNHENDQIEQEQSQDKTPSGRDTFKRDLKLFGNVKVLCVSALLCALTFVLAFAAKLIQGTSPLRFTIEGLPIILSGILFGPLIGAVIGVGSDLLSCALSGQAINPLITVGVACIGLLAGLISHYIRTKPGLLQIILCESVSHLVGSVVIKSVALHTYGYEWAYLALRIPIYIGVIVIESILLYLLLQSKIIQKEIRRLYS
ncbi:MAG: folate family ECF transporter S component [Clostridia bacterium]|nr:folate family ECF transporter S component [Clostridia bacterium]